MIEIRTLENTSFDEILECFLKAFEGYFVPMPQDRAYYASRWEAAGIRHDLSFGAFSNDLLVGFILHCYERRHGYDIAFNTGTGVIPEFRGRQLVTSIYQQAIPKLVSEGITRSILEVITKNHRAKKIYEHCGFKVTRYYKCYNGQVNSESVPADLKPVTYDQIDWPKVPNKNLQSWDNYWETLRNGPYQFFEGYLNEQAIGVVAINQDFKIMSLFESYVDNQKHLGSLLAGVGKITGSIRISNVHDSLDNKNQALAKGGLDNIIDQYEMELNLEAVTI